MKNNFFNLACTTAILLFTQTSFAQTPKKDNKNNNDIIIIKPKTDKDTKIILEIKEGDVTINGKTLSEFQDENITITRRKQLPPPPGDVLMYRNEMRPPLPPFPEDPTINADDLSLFLNTNSNKAFLGVSTKKTDAGVTITEITNDSPAEKAGLKTGDVITAVNDSKIESHNDIVNEVRKYKPNDKISVTIKRNNKEEKITATLAKTKGTLRFNAPEANFNFNSDNFNNSFDFHNFSWANKGKLGIKAQETEDGKGIKVLNVVSESPADQAGIKEGDIITLFNGTEVKDVDTLRELSTTAMNNKTSFKIMLIRNGKQQEVDIKIPKNLKTASL